MNLFSRAEVSQRLWQVAEHNIIAEMICCEPLEPGHSLCAQGYTALEVAKALLVDDPEAHKPAPLLNTVTQLLDAQADLGPAIEAPDATVILAARHLDATEGPVQVGYYVDQSTRFAIDHVLRYISQAYNSTSVDMCELPRQTVQEEDVCEEQRVTAGTAEPDDTARCAHCIHLKADHSDRDDQWASEIVPRRPWCHTCDETCDYAPIGDMTQHPMALTFRYRNHRGETADRTVLPLRIWNGSTQWHTEAQWLLQAYDTERNAMRDFALSGMQGTTADSPALQRLKTAAHDATEAAHLHAMHGMKRVFQLCRRYGDQMIPTAWVLDALGLDENANTTIDLTAASDTEPSGRDALMQAHTALATQSARDQATLGRLRHLHDSLAGESTLSGPDDLITQRSAARRIATALDGPNPAELPPCDAEFEGGGHCAKPVGHRPPGSDDPHVPATATCGHTKSTNGAVYPPCGRAPGHEEAYCYSADGSAYFIALHGETAHGEQPQPQKDDA